VGKEKLLYTVAPSRHPFPLNKMMAPPTFSGFRQSWNCLKSGLLYAMSMGGGSRCREWVIFVASVNQILQMRGMGTTGIQRPRRRTIIENRYLLVPTSAAWGFIFGASVAEPGLEPEPHQN
jgi:hypothetical protein